MAGWMDSTGTGRGSGGSDFSNRRYSSDPIHGGSGGGGSNRWRGERSRGRPPPQPQYVYRPVDASRSSPHQSALPTISELPTASTSTRHSQMSHPATASDNSPASGTGAPACSNKEPDDKGSRNAANFECNVCFDMAAEPVVTKCGHLFCWECLYQWLHVHSHDRECPVCKGQVAEDAVIPIYGRGGSAAAVDKALHSVPPRPTGARVESSRQQQENYNQLYTLPYQDLDDDEDNPFDFTSMMGWGRGPVADPVRDALRNFMSLDASFDEGIMDDPYDDYSYEFNPEFEETYNYERIYVYDNLSQMHADMIDYMTPSVHHREFGYSSPHSRNRGQNGRRRRARPSADQSSTDTMVTMGRSAFYGDTGANSNGSVGAYYRPNGGWAERRGRSNRNPNSTGGRGMQDSRRHQWR